MSPPQDPRLSEFQPRSMLRLPKTRVDHARFPVIDFHTHLSFSPGYADPAPGGGESHVLLSPARALGVMNAVGIDLMVNVTGGFGTCLDRNISHFVSPHPTRFAVFTEPWWHKVDEPGYDQFQADEIIRAKRAGARGLKVLKTLGLY